MKLIVLPLIGILAACSTIAPPHLAGPDDPDAPLPAYRYEPVTAGTNDYKPSYPKPWAIGPNVGEPAREGE